MLVDSHCHLDFPDFDTERDAVIARARAAGVGAMQTISTRLSEFEAVRRIAESYREVYCSVGVHPHNVASEAEVRAAELVKLAAHPKVIGIGETGLDYHYEHSPRESQRKSFRCHIEAAKETGLPVIVHTREADDDTIGILREAAESGGFSGLIHCFSTARPLAEAALELGLFISLSGIVTFEKAQGLREIARDLPLNRLLVETDAPYLAPVPKRGKRNEPSFLVHTVAFLAELLGLSADELARRTTENFFSLFGKAVPPPPADSE